MAKSTSMRKMAFRKVTTVRVLDNNTPVVAHIKVTQKGHLFSSRACVWHVERSYVPYGFWITRDEEEDDDEEEEEEEEEER